MPLPSAREPAQVASARRTAAIGSSGGWAGVLTSRSSHTPPSCARRRRRLGERADRQGADRSSGRLTGPAATSYHCALRCIRIQRSTHVRAARAPLAFAFVIALGAVVVPAGPAVGPAAATIRTTMTTVDAADLSPATAETTLVAMINADRAAGPT